jgi:3-phosphoshikimate 1-carboxyvinyltransferase
MAHRALICGALSSDSVVTHLAFSKDIEATLGCLKALGVNVQQQGSSVRLGGFDPAAVPDGATLFCNESGSTLRFLIPLCMLAGKPVTLTGSERLFERPLTVYEDIAREQGISFVKERDRVTVCGKMHSGGYTVP